MMRFFASALMASALALAARPIAVGGVGVAEGEDELRATVDALHETLRTMEYGSDE